jgi:CheY-like chemotaxis protein
MPLDHPSPVESTPSTILVVEPDILVRVIIADHLRNCGYRVFEGATADDVVTVLGSRQKIDVVFAEVQLSGIMDGFGLAQWAREKHPGIDVILTAGKARAAEKAGDLCAQEVLRRINSLIERR